MTKLEQLQRSLARAIVDPGAAAPAIRPSGTLSPEAAVNIYRADYQVRLVAALGEHFDAVRCVLGPAEFRAIAKAYVRLTPARSHNLDDYGDGFPEFLGASDAALAYPFMTELAAFEWEFKELFHQREHSHAAPQAFAQAGPNAALRLGGACRMFRHQWKCSRIWSEKKAIDFEGSEQVVLYKNGGEIWQHALGEPEFFLLEQLRRGLVLDAALSRTADKYSELSRKRVAGFFSFLASSGLVAEVS